MSVSASKSRTRRTTPPPRRTARLPSEASRRLSEYLRTSLAKRWLRYTRELRRCGTSWTESSVHDLRVSLRRLISVLDMAASVVQEPRSTRVRRGLQRTLRSLSELRDIQVQLLLVRDMLPRHPQLALVRTILLMKQTRCIRRMRARVSRLSITTDAMAVEHLTACIDRAFQDSSRARQRRAAVVATTTLAFARAVQMKELVDRARPASIHRLRVAFKKFRYRAETLQPLLPSLTRDRLSAMNAYQTRMGSIQDVDLLLVVVRGLAARRRRGDPPLRPVVLELLERRRELIRMFLASSADLYGFWPVPVHAPLTVFAGARRTS